MADHLEEWLASLPVNEPVSIDGEQAYLRVGPRGAELGVYLLRHFTPAQMEDAAHAGFQSARQFDAGLALLDDNALVLNQWLPDVDSWPQAIDALEEILNQAALWRALMAPAPRRQEGAASPGEQRIRAMFARERA